LQCAPRRVIQDCRIIIDYCGQSLALGHNTRLVLVLPLAFVRVQVFALVQWQMPWLSILRLVETLLVRAHRFPSVVAPWGHGLHMRNFNNCRQQHRQYPPNYKPCRKASLLHPFPHGGCCCCCCCCCCCGDHCVTTTTTPMSDDFLRAVPVAHHKYQTASQLPNTFSYGKIVTSMTFTCVRHRKRGHNKASFWVVRFKVGGFQDFGSFGNGGWYAASCTCTRLIRSTARSGYGSFIWNCRWPLYRVQGGRQE
jgi:hypothetical protein